MSRRGANKHIIRIRQGAQEKSLAVDHDEFIIGSGSGTQVRIGSPAVSDKHLQIRISGEQVQVRDLQSSYGTFFAGRKLDPDETLTLASPSEECYLGNIIALSITPKYSPVNASDPIRDTSAEKNANPSGEAMISSAASTLVSSGSLPETSGRVIQLQRSPLEPQRTQSNSLPDGSQHFANAMREEARRHAREIISKAEQKKSDIEEQVLKTQAKWHDLRAGLEALEIEKSKVEQDILRARSHLDSLTDVISELELKKEQYTKLILDSQTRREAVEIEIVQAKNHIEALQQEIATRKSEVREHIGEISRLQTVMTELRHAVNEVRERLRREREVEDFELRSREARYDALQAEFQAKQAAMEAAIAEIEIRKTTLECELRDAEAEKVTVIQESDKAKKFAQIEIDQAKARLQHFETEAEKLIEKVEAEKKAKEHLRMESLELQASIQNLIFQRDKLLLDSSEVRDKLEHNLLTLNESKKRLEFEIEGIKTEIDGLTRRRDEIVRENNRLTDEAARREEEALSRLRTLESESRVLQDKLEFDRSEAERYRTEAANHKAQISVLQSEITVAEERARSTETDSGQMKMKLEQEIRDLASKREVLSFEVAEQQKRLDFEIEVRQKAAMTDLESQLRKKKEDADREFVEARAALQSQVEETRRAETERLAKLREDALRTERMRRSHILEEIVRGTLELAGKSNLSEVEVDFRGLVQSALEGKSSAALSAKAAERTRRFWKKAAIWSAGPLGVVMILAIFPELPEHLGSMLQKKVAAQKQDGGVFLEEIRQRGLMWQPEKIDRKYRSTYRDNVIELEGYVELKANEAKQKEWTLLLNDFIVGRLGLSDRVLPDFLATESVMVKELHEARKNIVPQFKEQGFKRMAEIEQKNLEILTNILQSDENYAKFRSLEKSFYEEYMKTVAAPPNPSKTKSE